MNFIAVANLLFKLSHQFSERSCRQPCLKQTLLNSDSMHLQQFYYAAALLIIAYIKRYQQMH